MNAVTAITVAWKYERSICGVFAATKNLPCHKDDSGAPAQPTTAAFSAATDARKTHFRDFLWKFGGNPPARRRFPSALGDAQRAFEIGQHLDLAAPVPLAPLGDRRVLDLGEHF